jgi:hypothetical protein
MAKYSVSISHAPDKAAIAKVIRSVSDISIADIVTSIGTSNPIAWFGTWDFSLEMGYEEGVIYQQERLSKFVASLAEAGAIVVVSHHAGEISEIVSREMLENLFESELQRLAQEHD